MKWLQRSNAPSGYVFTVTEPDRGQAINGNYLNSTIYAMVLMTDTIL